VLKPDSAYDKDGIFTGCFYPSGVHGEPGQLTVFYTSVTNLPIHWTLPYTRNCEGLALATSSDGGNTWHKNKVNPILHGEPDNVVVTGFRDPYLARWPAMDRIRGRKSLYGILSGGILNQGPTMFLYAVSPSDLTKWDYIGTLGDLEAGFRPSPLWSGDFGVNWECVNFMTLRDQKKEFQFLTLGSEGGLPWGSEDGCEDTSQAQTLWLAGTLAGSAQKPKMKYNFSGVLDHGCLYAVATYEHPITHQRVAWGWLKEDDLTLERRTAKGWTGHLSLPRELFLYSKPNVTRGLVSSLEDIHSIHWEENAPEPHKGSTVWTLGIRPMTSSKGLRRQKQASWSSIKCDGKQGQLALVNFHWELEALIQVSANSGKVGFVICQDKDASLGTKVFYDLDNQIITVDRSLSNTEADIKKGNISGAFTLLVSDEHGKEVVEDLHLRIFRDGDVLEVFVNDRFALSTMVYSNMACRGISCFVEGGTTNQTVFKSIDIWDLGNVFEDAQPRTRI
jgi:beta-fructofuranosidase